MSEGYGPLAYTSYTSNFHHTCNSIYLWNFTLKWLCVHSIMTLLGGCDLPSKILIPNINYSPALKFSPSCVTNETTIEGHLFWHKINLFPRVLPHVNLTLVEASLNPTWKLHSNTNKDEIELPLCSCAVCRWRIRSPSHTPLPTSL